MLAKPAGLSLGGIGTQLSAGFIVGLSAVIYSISYGALLFAGRLSSHVGHAITVALITAAIGAAISAFWGRSDEERSFIYGPDSNTISVMGSALAATMALPQFAAAEVDGLQLALATLCLTSMLAGGFFYLVVRLNLADMVRFIPFPVMAGFLASTGWLMASGALNIIAGTPLTLAGLQHFLEQPWRPQLLCGAAIAWLLFRLSGRLSAAVLIPATMLGAAVLVNVAIAAGWCAAPSCTRADWLFAGLGGADWMPPWQLDWHAGLLRDLLPLLPSMFVVSFVGVLTILLSVASLELSCGREFDLNHIIRIHARAALLGAAAGGFPGIVSMGRTALNRQAGGRRLAGVFAALCCLAVLGGAGALIGYMPKAALGGLVLFLGLGMIKQWLWDQRHVATRLELAQVVLIVVLVANFGYLVGFFCGVLLACIIFVVTYSRLPLTSRSTDLASFSSAVIRPRQQVEVLKARGHRIRLFRLNGFIFFGSAAKIDAMFARMDMAALDGVVLDFSQAAGIDNSAISVFQRILRRYSHLPVEFYFVHNADTSDSLQRISQDAQARRRVHYYPTLDFALEIAEERLLDAHQSEVQADDCFDFLEDAAARALFRSYCVVREVVAGDSLCEEGDRSDAVFFIEQGSFDVVKRTGQEDSLRLAKLTPGAITGEMAFYVGAPRSATIRAVGPGRVHVLERGALERLRAEQAALATMFDLMIIRKMAGTLARTNELVIALG